MDPIGPSAVLEVSVFPPGTTRDKQDTAGEEELEEEVELSTKLPVLAWDCCCVETKTEG